VADVTLLVDALSPRPGGIGRYTWELCKGLRDHRGIGSLRYFAHNQLIEDPDRLVRGEHPPRARNLARNWLDKRAIRSSIVHGPNYFLPAFVDSGVITVHDLSVFRFPETHPADRLLEFEREFLNSLSRAAQVITDTETVRNELIATFAVQPDIVTAVPLGVDSTFHPRSAETLAATLEVHGLRPRHYGLCVSTVEPRKKISELLASWRGLPRLLRDQCPLVLCGGAGWRNEGLHEQIRDGVSEGWLRYLGFVDERLLPHLYAGSSLFVYPSTYEGFGLPPLEAMASGVPVIVSDRSCLPEVCGDAARYVDPDDAASFVAIIEQCLTDDNWRKGAIGRGLEHARQFSWRRCIDNTVEVYDKVSPAG